ncbi:MAG: ThiF family adenylyltransferase [Nitrococcus mobilis]|nr:ThiF family adenylyltransferase [Nitrococcus mobilis]
MDGGFDYQLAFSRTVGWITEEEQAILRSKRVAIAGLGGVGGSHLLTLTRLGIGAFTLAEMDSFGIENLNRQAGAFMSTLQRPKLEVLAAMARDVNPELSLRTLPEGVTESNLADFLDGVDLYLDSLDFFALDARRRVFAECAKRGIPAITAAPLGMGTALLAFHPAGMSFEEYFQLENATQSEQYLRFLLGLSPAMLQMRYLVAPEAVNLAGQKGPSTPMACELCAGAAGTVALKILLRRGHTPFAPRGIHFDAYRTKLVRTWRPWGNRNPLQRLALVIARQRLASVAQRRSKHQPKKRTNPTPPRSAPIWDILEQARWAPSGDNAQPWRFQVIDPEEIVIHIPSERNDNVYEYNDAQPSWLSRGFLLETLRIAASRHARKLSWRLETNQEGRQLIRVKLAPIAGGGDADKLHSVIVQRSVDRRRYQLRQLPTALRHQLELALGDDLQISWAESLSERWRWALINAAATHIRLSIPEAYPVHQRILDWHRQRSPVGVPAAAVGANPITQRLMRWALADWARVNFLNRYLAGTLTPRLEFDLIPGLFCAAHFWVALKQTPDTRLPNERLLELGMRLQRFWLTATTLNLVIQPSLAPLAFSFYSRNRIPFTTNQEGVSKAGRLNDKLSLALQGTAPSAVIFAGRIGFPLGNPPLSRSIRLAVEELMLPTEG